MRTSLTVLPQSFRYFAPRLILPYACHKIIKAPFKAIDFKCSHYPKDVILHAVFSMSATLFHTATFRKYQTSEAS
jgi:hypothetical protein